ncbi:MAG: methylated-DNA--[protein]-cysteine S-methyltransferase [Treponema sp.]|jgi:methylated-DNA-[protein]-cysteine S-methyltransferase|nr:methylated-DNA--[protein]-cysteine S-methyltransferase [Treponema sp.]
MIYTCVIDTPVGAMRAAAENNALIRLDFTERQRFTPDTADWSDAPQEPVFEQLREWLATYFSGKSPAITPPLNPHGTAFRHSVWDLLLQIPYGETTSYGELAHKLGSSKGFSARAVGGAVGHNPINIIIPCHRVIGADGSLTGYGGGLDRKRALLTLEGVRLSDHLKNRS